MPICSTGPFAGMDAAVLQANLTKAQQAYLDLSMGSKGESFSYAQGDGVKAVTYSKANMGQLLVLIGQLKQALGISPRGRRPIRPVFR